MSAPGVRHLGPRGNATVESARAGSTGRGPACARPRMPVLRRRVTRRPGCTVLSALRAEPVDQAMPCLQHGTGGGVAVLHYLRTSGGVALGAMRHARATRIFLLDPLSPLHDIRPSRPGGSAGWFARSSGSGRARTCACPSDGTAGTTLDAPDERPRHSFCDLGNEVGIPPSTCGRHSPKSGDASSPPEETGVVLVVRIHGGGRLTRRELAPRQRRSR